MNLTAVGLDIAKNTFQAHGVDAHGKAVLKRKLTRAKVLSFFANLPACVVGIEACAGSHYWAREIRKLGHDVRLLPAQHVKHLVIGNKTDAHDAEAICAAAVSPRIVPVAINTEAQQDLQMLHRIRRRLVDARSALMAQARGLLGEYGIVLAPGPARLRRGLNETLSRSGSLSSFAQELLQDLRTQLTELDARIRDYDQSRRCD